MKTIKKQSFIVDVLIWAFLILTAIVILAPIIFMFTASLMPSRDILKMPYPWIPKDLYWQNYWQALRGNDGSFIFPRNILNSFIVAGVVSISTVFLSALTGYGLAKFPFRGRNLVFLLIMATMMIPFEAIMIPLYLVATSLKIQNSYIGLILPFLMNAFGIFLMRQYLITFPDEIIDAEMKTIPLYIVKFATEKHTNEGAMMAAAVIASIPILVLFLALSKYFVSGASLHSSRKG